MRALNVTLWENLVLVVVLVLGSKGPYYYRILWPDLKTALPRRKIQPRIHLLITCIFAALQATFSRSNMSICVWNLKYEIYNIKKMSISLNNLETHTKTMNNNIDDIIDLGFCKCFRQKIFWKIWQIKCSDMHIILAFFFGPISFSFTFSHN